MARLVLEFLSAREVSPVALVHLAAINGVRAISVCIRPFRALAGDAMPFGELIDWDLIGDTPNRRELKRRCEDAGIAIASADVFLLGPQAEVEGFRAALASAAWLGADAVTAIPLDPDLTRLADTFTAFCALAGEHGLTAIHEHSPRMALKTVRDSLAFQRRLGLPNLRMVVDALHVFRGDNRIADLAAIGADELARVQLCDGPAEPPARGGGYEAFYERMVPGEGTFPLADLIAAIPAGVDFGLEVPLWEQQQAGVQPADRVRHIVAASRRLLGDRVG